MTKEKPNHSEVRRNALFEDFAERASDYLSKTCNVAPDEAIQAGLGLVDLLRDAWGGQTIYIPVDHRFRASQRDWEIHRRMERGNAHDLAAEYGLSFVRIYQIYKRCCQEMRERAAAAGPAPPPVAYFEPARLPSPPAPVQAAAVDTWPFPSLAGEIK